MTSRSFYSNPETERLINRKAGPTRGGISDIVNRSIQRMDEIVHRHRPSLTAQEWHVVFKALDGVVFHSPAKIQEVWIYVSDAIRSDRLDRQWNVDGINLVHRLQALAYAENVAIVETAETYWAGVDGGPDQPALNGSESETHESETQLFQRLGFLPRTEPRTEAA